MKLSRIRCALLGLLLAAGTQAATAANVTETFDSSANGWKVSDIDPSGSNPYLNVVGSYTANWSAGAINALDPSGNSFYFDAAPAFLGNKAAFAGGKLSFDTYVTPAITSSNQWRYDPDIVLSNGTTTLVWQAAVNPGSTPWTHVSTTLGIDNGWRVGNLSGSSATASDFNSVLGNLTVLRLRGEYINGITETTHIDNVVLAAVPEPETWAMFAAGLGLLGFFGKRRRNA